MDHTPGFLKVVEEAKKSVKELSVEEVGKKLQEKGKFYFIDVREDDEYRAGHAKGALHIGKGVIERDIETAIPNKSAEIILYCGGGFRSALAAASIQKMGYTNVISMDGGMRAWKAAGLPTET